MPPKSKPRAEYPIRCARQWRGIVWHHSVMENGDALDWDSIDEAHRSYRVDGRPVDVVEYRKAFIMHTGSQFNEPMRDIGFHMGVEFSEVKGVFLPVIKTGRSLELSGKHTSSPTHEEQYLGFCAIGNFDAKSMRPEMYDTCLRLTRTFMDFFQIPEDKVLAHSEIFSKLNIPGSSTCPGSLWSFPKFRRDL